MAYEDLNTKFVAYTNENLTDLSPVVNEINSIKQGLARLLTTPKGHNPFNREYGSSLYSLLFENRLNCSNYLFSMGKKKRLNLKNISISQKSSARLVLQAHLRKAEVF